MAGTHYYAEAFPYYNGYLGPGSFNILMGSEPGFSKETVWYNPCIDDPDACKSLHFEPKGNKWWDVTVAMLNEGVHKRAGTSWASRTWWRTWTRLRPCGIRKKY